MRERSYSWEVSAVRYRIGRDSILNTHANSITVGGRLIELEHRLVLLLVYFIHHKGEVLSKELLLKTIWQGKVVNEDSLSVAVSHIRKALGDNPRAPQFIKTIPGVGYQFIGEAEALEEAPAVAASEPAFGVQSSHPRRWWLGAALVVLLVTGVVIYVGQPRPAVATGAGNLSAEGAKQLQLADQALQKNGPESWRLAIKYYRDLIASEGDVASAYLGIADAKMKLTGDQLVVRDNCIEVVGLLNKAVSIDPNIAAIHRSLANASFWCQRDYQKAETHYLKAIKLNPNDAEAHMFYAELLLALQRFDESLRYVEKSRQLNPLNYSVPIVVWIYQMQGRDDLALRELGRIVNSEPDNRYFHISAERIYTRMGDAEKAFKERVWLMRESGISEERIAVAQARFDQQGLKGFNRWLLDEKIEADLGDYTPPLSWARYALVAGEYEQALDLLEAAYEKRQYPMLWARVDSAYDPVRDTPRFQKILEELKTVENQ
jgi:DNA-binding winged helix-turn-helix (wHTH) protein